MHESNGEALSLDKVLNLCSVVLSRVQGVCRSAKVHEMRKKGAAGLSERSQDLRSCYVSKGNLDHGATDPEHRRPAKRPFRSLMLAAS